MLDLSTTGFLFTLLKTWLGLYTLLAGVYLAVGWLVSRYNLSHLQAYRIQNKGCPAELIKRDFRQSLKSLISISGMLAAGIVLRDVGFSLMALVGINLSGPSLLHSVLWLALSLVLFDSWFYWFHRLIHHPKLYVKVHRWHHRATTPTVWSNNSDTLLDNLFCQSYWFFAPLLLPVPTTVLVIHKLYDQITGMLGHAGYEYASGRFSAKPSPMIGTSFHDQHHSAFHYNFATHFSFWDRLMGTLHPDYDRLVRSYPKPIQELGK